MYARLNQPIARSLQANRFPYMAHSPARQLGFEQCVRKHLGNQADQNVFPLALLQALDRQLFE